MRSSLTTTLELEATPPAGYANFGPLAAVIVVAVHVGDPSPLGAWLSLGSLGAGLLIVLASLVAARSPLLARWGYTVGIVAAMAMSVPALSYRPVLALVLALACTLFLFRVWRSPSLEVGRPGGPRFVEAVRERLILEEGRSCVWAAAATCLLASFGLGHAALAAEGLATVSLVIAAVLMRRRSGEGRYAKVRHGLGLGLLVIGAAASAAVLMARLPPSSLPVIAAIPVVAAVLLPSEVASTDRAGWNIVFDHPARLLVVTFVGLCAVGTVCLALPWSGSNQTSIGVLNAAFTSVSATCVTGLTVLDTASAFSGFGKVWILLLIQLGGLGIMTISTAAIGLLGRRLSLRQEGAMAELVSQENRADLFRALRRTLLVTTSFELVGGALLSLLFWRNGDSVGQAIWRGVFTSISAFCNAGFALQTDNLVPYQSQPLVLHVVGVLIIAGGLSPAAIVMLPRAVRGRAIPLQVRVAIVTTAALLVVGFIGIAALEWSASLAHMSVVDRLHNAWFQSVTTRTAGFNSVDMTALHPATTTLMLVWMLVGGCPGGTAGGIKTTTAFVLLLAIAGSLRGSSVATAFGRTLSSRTVFKATAIATLGVLAAVTATLVIQITHPLQLDIAAFEVVSALGTVGLTIGGTPQLDEVGKVVIMVCMFMGRVGPLTAFLILSERGGDASWKLPEEEIEVG